MKMPHRPHRPHHPPIQHVHSGAALLVVLLMLGLIAITLTVHGFRNSLFSEYLTRQQIDRLALAHAKEAVLGDAVTYRDTHANETHGYLRCPDLENKKGEAAAPCGARDIPSLGRVPWKTLGIPPLRDHAGECLWYVVSGRAKNNPKTAIYNWDTPGQFIVRDATGNILAGASPHERPLALLFAPGFVNGHQNRAESSPATLPAAECGGNLLPENYLESLGTPAGELSTITLAAMQTRTTPGESFNNDVVTWITSDDIFQRIMQRNDFQRDIDQLLDDFAACLGNWPLARLPATSATAKGLLDAAALCPPAALDGGNNFRNNWEEQLLYTHPALAAQIQMTDGMTETCDAILLFGGRRSTQQTRASDTEKSLPAMYLENGNAALFPDSGLYTGASHFTPSNPSQEVLRCIRGLPPSIQQISLAGHIDQFAAVGSSVNKKKEVAAAPVRPTTLSGKSSVIFSSTPASEAGCLWYPQALPLAGKRWRIHYSFRFEQSDTYATAANKTTLDRGKGFTLQILRGDLGAPDNCGSLADMGVLNADDTRGKSSLLIETDVHQDSAHHDPNGNHSAILLNGNLAHGTALGSNCSPDPGESSCLQHTPASTFEDSPIATHNQRIEIQTGCDSSCTHCHPPAHASAGQHHARIQVWIDCQNCMGIQADLSTDNPKPASLSRCIALPTEMDTAYFGFTSGFLPAAAGSASSAAPRQGASIGNFYLGIE